MEQSLHYPTDYFTIEKGDDGAASVNVEGGLEV